MNAPLVEFLRRFRERERENANQNSLPYPIILHAQTRDTRGASATQAESSRGDRPVAR
jgi:hypothetical protein